MFRLLTNKQAQVIVDKLVNQLRITLMDHGVRPKTSSINRYRLALERIFKIKK